MIYICAVVLGYGKKIDQNNKPGKELPLIVEEIPNLALDYGSTWFNGFICRPINPRNAMFVVPGMIECIEKGQRR